jgi:hypothetical protein
VPLLGLLAQGSSLRFLVRVRLALVGGECAGYGVMRFLRAVFLLDQYLGVSLAQSVEGLGRCRMDVLHPRYVAELQVLELVRVLNS